MGCAQSADSESASTTPTIVRNSYSVIPSAEALGRIKELWAKWDYDAQGKIELAAFRGASVKVGPYESRVLDQLSAMDFDSDGFVTSDEWDKYFASAAETLAPDELSVVLDDLSAAADTMVRAHT